MSCMFFLLKKKPCIHGVLAQVHVGLFLLNQRFLSPTMFRLFFQIPLTFLFLKLVVLLPFLFFLILKINY
jgi:hypothetical protein